MKFIPDFAVREGNKTGRRRYRQDWLGRIILQLEVEKERVSTTPLFDEEKQERKVIGVEWRDARWIEAGLNLWPVSSEFTCVDKQDSNNNPYAVLSGQRRYRRSFFESLGEKVILQVEAVIHEHMDNSGPPRPVENRWRDAKLKDVNFRGLDPEVHQRFSLTTEGVKEYTYPR